MESTRTCFNTIIIPILPFMDVIYFEDILKSDSIAFKNIQNVNGENKLPSKNNCLILIRICIHIIIFKVGGRFVPFKIRRKKFSKFEIEIFLYRRNKSTRIRNKY